jgi:hypothetical protein
MLHAPFLGIRERALDTVEASALALNCKALVRCSFCVSVDSFVAVRFRQPATVFSSAVASSGLRLKAFSTADSFSAAKTAFSAPSFPWHS